MDTDAVARGCKPARDAVAEWIGLDDGDPCLLWDYHQVVGKPEGLIVLIRECKPKLDSQG